MSEQTSENLRTLHHRRRRNRNREDIWSVLSEAPAPFGTSAPAHYRDIGIWARDASPGYQDAVGSLDWSAIPPSCEPCALLNNPANRGKKHGKTVLEQLDLIQFDRVVSDEALISGNASELLSGLPSSQDRRGMQKRWQVTHRTCQCLDHFVLTILKFIMP